MFKEKPFWYKWASSYLVQLLLIAVATVILLVLGRAICYAIPWRNPDSILYFWLKMIDYNTKTFFFIVMSFCSVLLAVWHFHNFGKAMEETQKAITGIYENPEKKISLPANFHDMEMELNEVRIKTHADQQAAKEANQRKNDLIMYMAHDLKTPLTSVIGYLTLVAGEPDIPMDVKEKYMTIALKKSHRLEDLINEFFDITRMNYQTVTAYKTPVNLTILLVQIINEFFPMMEEKNITARQEIEPELVLSADADKLARVFDNLFRNAVNYSHADTEIVCNARKGNGCILVNIKNQGDPVSPEKLQHVFDKFYRLDSSRQTTTGGAGLGLAIAKQIVELHDGTIEAVCNDGIMEFRIVLPV